MSRLTQLSPDQREAVIEEMNRILADPSFNGSKRCVVLFKYLVSCALTGDQNEFKERTLGIEVFGRNPSYDSQADPIVRVTANEIRKRLGQCYYEEQDSHHPVKIRLVRGGYIPEFDFSGADHSDADEVEVLGESLIPSSLPPAEIPQFGRAHALALTVLRRKWHLSIMIIILAIITGTALYRYHHHHALSNQELFWEPLLHFDPPLVVCVADDPSLVGTSGEDRAQKIADASVSNPTPLISNLPDSIPSTPFVDMTAANQISSWFVSRGRKVFLQRSSTATLHIFRQGPAVVIGGFDNPWSLILLSNLRYHIHIDPSTHEKWIEDAQNPSNHDWKINAGLHFDDSYVDYAVIARFWDSQTENWIVAVSSLGHHGSRAASELITDNSFAKSLPPGISSTGNFQIVVKTSVIIGSSSPPQVLAFYAW
jgi:hypothetical protein